jgi:hypothetical protein
MTTKTKLDILVDIERQLTKSYGEAVVAGEIGIAKFIQNTSRRVRNEIAALIREQECAE